MADKDLLSGLSEYLDRIQPPWIASGRVNSVSGNSAYVFISNNAQAQQALVGRSLTIVPGDQVVLIKPDRNVRWVVVANYGTQQLGQIGSQAIPKSVSVGSKSSGSSSGGSSGELAPPSGLVYKSLAGAVVFEWASPPQKPVAFEIQTNSTPVDSGADSRLITRGSYFIDTRTDPVYARVRSVDTDFSVSGWTAWVRGFPILAFTSTHIIADMIIPAETQYIVWNHLTNDAIITIDGELVIL